MLDTGASQLGRGETIEDTAQVLSRYVSAIVLRTSAHGRIETLAAHASVPVVNALTDLSHPCQWLADLMTIREHRGNPAGMTLTYVGDGNNVAHSILLGGALAGMHVRVATPRVSNPQPRSSQRASALAAASSGSVTVTTDPVAASENADVLYTDVWTSMGQEAEAARRLVAFAGYQLDDAAGRSRRRRRDGVALPAGAPGRGDRGRRSSTGRIRSSSTQAENRLHARRRCCRSSCRRAMMASNARSERPAVAARRRAADQGGAACAHHPAARQNASAVGSPSSSRCSRREGMTVTQATLSRDLEELGAVRLRAAAGGFVYVVPRDSDDQVSRPASDRVQSASAAHARLIRRRGSCSISVSRVGQPRGRADAARRRAPARGRHRPRRPRHCHRYRRR